MINQLISYIPDAAKESLDHLLKEYPFHLKITRGRKTKRGDFRATKPIPSITINNNLSKEQFLITLVHEIAHLYTYHEYPKAKPHGKEWKHCFQKLMLPFLNTQIFEDSLLKLLAQHFKNPKATTDSDPKLAVQLQLKKNPLDMDKCFIFDLEPGNLFQFNQRVFKILNKRRTRYECLEVKTKKRFLINGSASVQVI
ncbi:SprT-like domain-containing protein [Wenyingzhuangia sp. 1_MG-2023]|nr:SprT-like domain-containing protein [Wenyingzhuangia sp. 1_MG-2023]